MSLTPGPVSRYCCAWYQISFILGQANSPLPAKSMNIVLLVALLFPAMRYELDAEALTLRYGPALTYRIPLDDVHAIERRDLSLSLWSSVRLPGLALFAVPYRGMGQVKMCATAASKGILLIETAEAVYGITPADESGLVAALEARRG